MRRESGLSKTVKEFLGNEFNIAEGIGHIREISSRGREMAVVELKDWETKQKIMKEKRN